jgi:putative lipase involved disintegration of autophagic bodies
MTVEPTAVKLEGLQIFGAKTQHHLTQNDSVSASILFELNSSCYSTGLDQISETYWNAYICVK